MPDPSTIPNKLKESAFGFFVPIDLVKAEEAKSRRLIRGIASTESIDLQGERVIQGGMDLAYFRDHGWINDEHEKVKVGAPTDARVTKAGLWIEGQLLDGLEPVHKGGCICPPCRADYWWGFLQSIEKSGVNRRVGFSIEGKVLRRSANAIVKCWVRNVAITDSPIQTETWAEIAKSLSGQPWCDLTDNLDDPSCRCDGCRIGEEATLKAFQDGLEYEDAVRYIHEVRGWDPVVARVMATAIFSAQAN